jgi:hypothetical protein
MKRRTELIERLQAENRELRQKAAAGHAACDARIAELEALLANIAPNYR